MNKIKQLAKLSAVFNEEKRFIKDGYYRLRTLDERTIELAYLIAGPCGESTVHPQITVALDDTRATGIKLIDMASSPPLFLSRDEVNAAKIDCALDQLIEKFLQKI